MIKQLFIILILLCSTALMTGCNKGDSNKHVQDFIDANSTDGGFTVDQPGEVMAELVTYLSETMESPTAPCIGCEELIQEMMLGRISGIVLDDNNNPIEGVEVRVAGSHNNYFFTSETGEFFLNDIQGDQKVVVNFAHKGFRKSSLIVYAEKSKDNYIQQKLDHVGDLRTFSNGDGVSLATNFMAKANLNSSAKIERKGAPYLGSVEAAFSFLSLHNHDSILKFSGLYKGEDSNGQELPFISYGLVNLELKDEQGLKLELAEGDTALITFPPNHKTEYKEVIPLFSYDHGTGKWKEEGSADRQEDGSYQANVPHTGVWSLSKTVENAPGTIYAHRIVHPDGTPATGVEVMAIYQSGSMSKDVTTDENGYFHLDMLPDLTYRLKAYAKEGRHYADYKYELSALKAGEVSVDQK